MDKGRALKIALLAAAAMIIMALISTAEKRHTFESKAPFVQTHGIVTAVNCQASGESKYSIRYSADGRELIRRSGSKAHRDLDVDCELVDLGKSVPVWYSASDATYVSLISPETARRRMNVELAAAILGYPLLAGGLFVVFRFTRGKNSELPPGPWR